MQFQKLERFWNAGSIQTMALIHLTDGREWTRHRSPQLGVPFVLCIWKSVEMHFHWKQ